MSKNNIELYSILVRMERRLFREIVLLSVLLFFCIPCFASGLSYNEYANSSPESTYCERLIAFENIDNDEHRGYKLKVEPGIINFGGYSCCEIVERAWVSYYNKDLDSALIYADKVIELYSEQAEFQQSKLSDFPPEAWLKSLGALNAVATSYFIKGEIYFEKGMNQEAKVSYQKILNDFSYAQAFDYDKELLIQLTAEVKKRLNNN